MKQYYTVDEVAKKWNLTNRQIQNLCKKGLLEGAFKFGNSWAIPMDAKRPDDHRLKEYKIANQGFSLVELIVVVAIMAVLTGVLTPSLLRYIEKAREAVDINAMKDCRQAVSIAYITGEVKEGELLAYYYNQGEFTHTMASNGDGKGTAASGGTVYDAGNGCPECNYDGSEDHSGDYLIASISLDKTVHVHWANTNLDLTLGLAQLDPRWVSWTKTDSRGTAGVNQRNETLKALGLNDNHEYTFNTTKDPDTYVAYIYNGQFPAHAAKNDKTAQAKIDEWMDNKETKAIAISVYTYNTKTKTTEYQGEQEGKAVLRKDASKGSWIQIQQ